MSITDVLRQYQGPVKPLLPAQRALVPLWLALLLKRQRRANILAPPWLHTQSLERLAHAETETFPDSFTPAPTVNPPSSSNINPSFIPSAPFLHSATADASPDGLPYHWLEIGELLLETAADDLVEPDNIRRLMRDIREARMAKMRRGTDVLSGEGEGVRLDGVGAMEVAEGRGFITGVVDGLRKISASKEIARREREAEERENGYEGTQDDDDMEL